MLSRGSGWEQVEFFFSLRPTGCWYVIVRRIVFLFIAPGTINPMDMHSNALNKAPFRRSAKLQKAAVSGNLVIEW